MLKSRSLLGVNEAMKHESNAVAGTLGKSFKSVIVFGIHGLGGHSGWFKNLEEELKKYNISFVAYDLPGFGQNHLLGKQKSEYVKGHIDSYKEWVDFIQAKYEDLKAKNPAYRIAILGHSMGTVIASCLPQIYKDDLFIMSVPGFKGASKTFDPIFTITTLKKVVVDKFLLGNDVFVTMPVSEKSKLTPAATDPLRVAEVTQTLLFEVLKMGEIAKQEVLKKTCPCFLVQIAGDTVVDNATQDKIYDKLSATHKMKRSYIGVDHDWIWDKEVTKLVVADLVEWIDRL